MIKLILSGYSKQTISNINLTLILKNCMELWENRAKHCQEFWLLLHTLKHNDQMASTPFSCYATQSCYTGKHDWERFKCHFSRRGYCWIQSLSLHRRQKRTRPAWKPARHISPQLYLSFLSRSSSQDRFAQCYMATCLAAIGHWRFESNQSIKPDHQDSFVCIQANGTATGSDRCHPNSH